MAKSFVAYLRVSTDKQGVSGNGIDAQSDSVARYVADTGGTLLTTYVEVESAAKHNLKNRPQLQAALAHAKRSKSVLLIAKLDRLSRSVLVTSQLLAANVEFVAVDFPQANRLNDSTDGRNGRARVAAHLRAHEGCDAVCEVARCEVRR